MKIVYIAGDGRSGSTLLESVLTNAEGTIGIGESYRFWKRFYEGDTLCGCGALISECELWSYVHQRLEEGIEEYDPSEVWERIQFLLKFKNVQKTQQLLLKKEWQPFLETVTLFYKSIVQKTQKNVLVDSSKSIGWLHVLKTIQFCELQVVHLERKLPSVANSWKKRVVLPEYPDKTVYMPVKGNWEITKNWLKIKYFLKRFKGDTNFAFVPYEDFVSNPHNWHEKMEAWAGSSIDLDKLVLPFNHAIGGNPMRMKSNGLLQIKKDDNGLSQLNMAERGYFKMIYAMAKSIL